MRIYISELKKNINIAFIVLLPIITDLFNSIFWNVVEELRLGETVFLIGIGLPAAISASICIFLIQNTKHRIWWYGYSLSCVVFVQIEIFLLFAWGIGSGSENFWLIFGFVLQLPSFYVLGIGFRKAFLYLLSIPPALLRKFNIHLIPDDLENEIVFKYEEENTSNDIVNKIELKLISLNDNVQKVSTEINKQSKVVQNDANSLLSDLFTLKNEYVSVHNRLESNRIELKKLEHLRSLSEEQVDSLLSRMGKTKVIDWIIGFVLGFFASFLVQLLSNKIPTL